MACGDLQQHHHWQLGKQWAVREGSWKLIGNPRDTGGEFLEGEDAVFLSDLGEDISERKNLRREHPETVERLTRLHDEWVKEVESQ